MEITDLLAWGIKKSASDLHLSAGLPPLFRIEGELHKINNYPILDNQKIQNLLYSVMNEKQCHQFECTGDIDFAFTIRVLSKLAITKKRG
ncbi:MAG: Twitching mobility protein [Legionellaceae bacterium]